MSYELFKSLHIIFVVTWFAGLFYMVRLFVYHAEALEQESGEKQKILCEQYKLMERRLWYGITWPSAVLVLVFGMGLLHHFTPLRENMWLVVKLIFVFFLYLYHFSLGSLRKKFSQDTLASSSKKMRFYNEVATVFLFAIVFLVVFKESLNAMKATCALIAFSIILFGAIQIYKKYRSNT